MATLEDLFYYLFISAFDLAVSNVSKVTVSGVTSGSAMSAFTLSLWLAAEPYNSTIVNNFLTLMSSGLRFNITLSTELILTTAGYDSKC